MKRGKVEFSTREIAQVAGTLDVIVIDRTGDGTFTASLTSDGGKTMVLMVENARTSSIALRDALLQHPNGRHVYDIDKR